MFKTINSINKAVLMVCDYDDTPDGFDNNAENDDD